MAQTEENVLQSMYEYERLLAPNGQEYIVRGAEVFCGKGERSCVLNLPESHGKTTADNRPVITHRDTGPQNVQGFGICSITNEKCSPSLSEWKHSKQESERIYNWNTYQYEYAVTRSSTATCKRNGGIVIFCSSGQVVPDYSGEKIDAIEIKKDEKKEWKRGDDGKDFLGHIKIVRPGIYNLGIYIDKSQNYIGGSVFLYKKNWYSSSLKFVGAHELCEHKNEYLEGFKDSETIIHISTDSSPSYVENNFFYWTIWATMELDMNIDYYIEIDCPNIYTFNYKLIVLDYIETNLEKLNRVMCEIDAFMKNTDSTISKIHQAVSDATAIDGVVAIGISGSAGGGAYISGAGQLVIDLHGNIGLQIVPGAGVEAGASADATAYVAIYPGIADISELEGFATEIGGSFGEGFIFSAAALFSGEGNDIEPAGFMLGAGVGAEGFLAEGHVAMSNTFPTIRLGNIFTGKWDKIFRQWDIIYSLWDKLYSPWVNKLHSNF